MSSPYKSKPGQALEIWAREDLRNQGVVRPCKSRSGQSIEI